MDHLTSKRLCGVIWHLKALFFYPLNVLGNFFLRLCVRMIFFSSWTCSGRQFIIFLVQESLPDSLFFNHPSPPSKSNGLSQRVGSRMGISGCDSFGLFLQLFLFKVLPPSMCKYYYLLNAYFLIIPWKWKALNCQFKTACLLAMKYEIACLQGCLG